MFKNIFTAYLSEVCAQDEYQENIDALDNDDLNSELIAQTLQMYNPYYIMKIINNGLCIGMVSFSYSEDNKSGFINNFYISDEHRNRGVGSEAYCIVEKILLGLGAEYIELNPVEKALPFYQRIGYSFIRTNSDGEDIYRKII